MRYWGLAVAKLAGIGGLLYLLLFGINAAWPEPELFLKHRVGHFGQDLGYTLAMLLLWLFGVALVYLAFLDHRYRCRTCLRRLRMPVTQGRWHRILLGPPRIDYICPFGHGTLRVPELHLPATLDPTWDPIKNMWRELEELDLEQSRK